MAATKRYFATRSKNRPNYTSETRLFFDLERAKKYIGNSGKIVEKLKNGKEQIVLELPLNEA